MKKIAFLPIFLIILTSCLTPKSEPVPKEEVIQEAVLAPEPEPVPEIEVVEPEPEPEVYVATEEVYDRTFEEVEILFDKLNSIIATGDFNTWKTYLSTEYIETYGNKDYLAEKSENPVLKDYGIKLKTLKDYFNFIVTTSRQNVIVDEIQFITKDKIKAFTYKNNNKYIVYVLIRSENGWIISD